MMRLHDQVAIITGVSHAGQVGFALARAFAREGAKVVISSRSVERVKAREEELRAEGADVLGVPADLMELHGNGFIRWRYADPKRGDDTWALLGSSRRVRRVNESILSSSTTTNGTSAHAWDPD